MLRGSTGLLLALLVAACAGEDPAGGTCTTGAVSCSSDAECGGFLCVAGCCTTDRSCLGDGECPEGELCNGGVCMPVSDGRCTSSSHCSGDTPYCDLASRSCVACLVDLHCDPGGSAVCNQARTCELVPGRCTSDAACANDPENRVHCDVPARTCVECTIEAHCIGTNVCVLNRCVPPNRACETSAACSGATPVCDTSTATCVECLEDECGPGKRCEDNRCVTASCSTHADCAQNVASPRCDVQTGVCVACVAHADCGDPTLRCEDHACVPAPGCTSDAACAAPDAWCLTDTGVCVECRSDAHCGSGRRCVGNACEDVTPAGCTSDASCLSTPLTPRCDATSGACVQCFEGDDCPASGRCSPTSNTCLPGCASDDYCAGATPRCQLSTNTCVECLGASDCDTGERCANGRCVAGCATHQDCANHPAGAFCRIETSACVECLDSGDCREEETCEQFECVGGNSGGVDQPCGAQGSCDDPDAVCVVDGDDAFCRVLCDPYASDCAPGRVCEWIGYAEDLLPVGVCVPPNGLGSEGDPCDSGADCELDLLCLPSGVNQRACTRLCDPDGGACNAGERCRGLPAFFDEESGEILPIGACAPTSSTFGDPCWSDYSQRGPNTVPDCGPSLTCAPGSLVADPSIIVSWCQYPAGSFAPGQGEADTTCTSGSSCRSGDCLGGPRRCNTSCHWTSDCTRAGLTNHVCLPYAWYALSPYTDEVNVSFTGACLPTCRSDAGCPADRHCRLSPTFENSGQYASSFYSYCYFNQGDPEGPNRRAGERCTDDAQCASGLCVTNGRADAKDGYCFGSCDASRGDQCDPENGVVCDPTGFGLPLNAGRDGIDGTSDDAWGRAFVCGGERCRSDWDCLGLSMDPARPRSCQLTLQVNGANTAFGATHELRTTCEPSVGPRQGGEACTNNSQCASGRCFTFSNGRSACFGACELDIDCAGLSTCETVDYGGQLLSACVP